MGRMARVVVPGVPHHVTQRGNNRQCVFCCDDDCEYYLSLYRHYARRYGLQTLAYCLMDNHVHWAVVPESGKTLAQVFHAVDTKYAGRMNARSRRSGHFYQGRFFSAALDDEYLWAAVRYVERNPVRAGIVMHAEEYPWSSAAGHCGARVDLLLADDFPPTGVIGDWRAWLGAEDGRASGLLRRQTATGRPCGGAAFIARLEAALQRVLRPRKRGPQPPVLAPGQRELFA